MNEVCPHCGAPLQPNARFCPHCMTALCEQTELPAPLSTKKKWWLPTLCLAAILLVGGGGKCRPACPIEQFREAAPLVSETMGIGDLWDLDSLTDTHYSTETKFRQYAVDTYLGDALLSLFFYNEGEEIGAYFCDVTPENRDRAESLLKCVVQSVCNRYFTDIDAVFDDERLYPKQDFPDPFITLYTDMLCRTDEYNAAMAADTAISSRYVVMQSSQEQITFVVTTRDTGGEVLYDLSVGITRAES